MVRSSNGRESSVDLKPMPPPDSFSTQDVINPPKGYNLLSSKKTDTPKKDVKDLKVQAAKLKPITPPTGYVIAAHSPSYLEQFRDVVANSAIGHSLESALPGIADALNLHPSETVNSPTYEAHKQQLLAPEYATKGFLDTMLLPGAKPLNQADTNRVEGALTAAGDLTSGQNMATMAGIAVGTGLTAGIVNPASARLLSRLVSGGFSLDMLKGLYQQNKDYRKAVDSGDMAAAQKIQGDMGVTGIMALMAGHHALTAHATPLAEPPTRERTNVLHRNTAGEVRHAPGQAPTVWLSPDAWKSFMGVMYPGEDATKTNGMNVTAGNKLYNFVNDPNLAPNDPHIAEVQQLMGAAHGAAGKSGVVVGSKTGEGVQHAINIMREERNHSWQRQLGGLIKNHLPQPVFESLNASIPKGMSNYLAGEGYSSTDHVERVAETAAKLMGAKDFSKYGTTPEEAAGFLKSYFDEVVKQHGVKALESLKHVRGVAADLKANIEAEHGRVANGQQDRGTVSGVPEGRGQPTQPAQVPDDFIGGDYLDPAFNRQRDEPQMSLFREMGEKLKQARANYSATKPETVKAYNEALRNYEFSSPAFMRKYLRDQMATMKTDGDVADIKELERIHNLGDAMFNREKEKPTWYLKSEKLIGDKMRGPMPAEDVGKMLRNGGISPDEMKWTGLDDYLKSKADVTPEEKKKGKDKVTPEEIREHLAENNIKLEEVHKGVPKPIEWKSYPNGDIYNSDGYTITRIPGNGLYSLRSHGGSNIGDIFDTLDEAKEKAEYYRNNTGENTVPTKYSYYQLPGGTNYREMLLTAPNLGRDIKYSRLVDDWRQAQKASLDYMNEHPMDVRTRDPIQFDLSHKLAIAKEALDKYKEEKDKASPGGVYRPDANAFITRHWEDHPNVLAHTRFNDRTGPNGERLLHLEELQSDWHQKGRDKGYQTDRSKEPMKATRNAGYWEVHLDDGEFVTNIQDWQHPDIKTEDQAIAEAQRRIHEAPERVRSSEKVPEAPLKKTWHEMALRRMLKHAVENGYDALSWTGGADQADRFNLAKRLDHIEYQKKSDGKYWIHAIAKDTGQSVFEDTVVPEKLPEIIGKEAANKVVAGEGDKNTGPHADVVARGIKRGSGTDVFQENGKWFIRFQDGSKLGTYPSSESATREMESINANLKSGPLMKLTGDDLKVGGEGMKGFYDKIIPDYLNKFGKKYGAKVGETQVVIPNQMEYEYSGPERTLEDVLALQELVNSNGPDKFETPFMDGKSKFAVNRAANRQAVEHVASSMTNGNEFQEAMQLHGSPSLAELFGGKLDQAKPEAKSVQYLPITPEMRQSLGEEGVPLFNREVGKDIWKTPRDEYAGWKPDETDEQSRERYRRSQEWDHSALAALSTGELTPQEARDKNIHVQPPASEFKPLPSKLYHVTTAANEIKNGKIRSRWETEQQSGKGLGGGDDKSISFTADPKTAATIEKSLLLAHDVATGKITVQDLVDMVNRGEGAPRPFPEEFKQALQAVIGGKDPLDVALRGVKSNYNMFAKPPENDGEGWKPASDSPHWTGGDGVERYSVWERPLTEKEAQESRWSIFKAFSPARQWAGGQEDPLFFSTDVEGLAKIDPNNIRTLEFDAAPGAMGTQHSALGEWRTYTGDAVKLKGEVEHDPDIPLFKPEQIKSAIGNSGAFDPNDADIARNRVKSFDSNTSMRGDSAENGSSSAENNEQVEGRTGTTPPTKPNDKTMKMLTSGKARAYTLDYWLKKQPGVSINSVQQEKLDPSSLHRVQDWTRDSKLADWQKNGVDASKFPPVEVVRTASGDYLYDGTHRTEYAARQGENINATVYNIGTRDEPVAERKEHAPTTVPSLTTTNVSVPLVTAMDIHPVVTTRVLPLSQIMQMAAAIAPERQVKGVRELMAEAQQRNPTKVVP